MKIKFLGAVFFALTLSFAGCLLGGDDSDNSGSTTPVTPVTPITPITPSYTVTFDTQGVSAVDPQTVTEDGLATEPAAQTRSYYTFGGWFREAACTNEWTFASDTVTADITLYAKWTQNSWEDFSGNPQTITSYTVEGTITYGEGSFSDVKGTAEGDVYVAGCFETFQGQNIRSVAKLSGTTWSPVGGTSLYLSSQVNAICFSGSDIYIGGNFGQVPFPYVPTLTGPKMIAKLSGDVWTSIGTLAPYGGWTAEVNDVICDASGNIYVAGNFISAGGNAAYSVAMYNGSTWSAIGNDDTYPGFVYLNGSNYEPAKMGGGIYQNGLHFDLDENLYVAPGPGTLNLVDGAAYSYNNNTNGYESLIRWDGSAWEGIVDVSADPYLDYKVHFNADGTSYLARIAPPWVPEGGTTGNHIGNVQATKSADAAVDDPEGDVDWKNIGYWNWVIGPDGTAYVYGSFTKARWRPTFNDPYTILDAKYLAVWKDGSLQAFGTLPADIKAVQKIFFMPSGDIWIIASITGYADNSRLFRMKK